MTSDVLIGLSGAVVSFAFSYVPGLKAWFEKFGGDQKRLIMLGVLLVTALGVYGLSCAGQVAYFPCTVEGLWGLLRLFMVAAVANQSAYLLSPGVDSK